MKPLSPREIQIVRLMADGKMDKEIAKELDSPVLTVRSHVRRIHAKFGTTSRVSAVTTAIAYGYFHVKRLDIDEDVDDDDDLPSGAVHLYDPGED